MVCMDLTMVISGKNFQKYDESSSHMNSTIVEYTEGIDVIKAFGRAGVSYEKYAKAINDFRVFVVKWLSSTYFTMKLAFALFPSTLIGTLPVALYLANSKTISAPQAALAVMLPISMVGSLAKLIARFWDVNSGSVSIGGVGKDIKPEHFDIEFKNVDFGYDSRKVLDNVSIRLPEKTSTAIVGPSGSGKTTICSLIVRFYDVDNGRVVESGTHAELIAQEGRYRDFVKIREKAEGWRITGA